LGYKLLKIEERKRLGNNGYNNVMVGFSLPNVGTKLLRITGVKYIENLSGSSIIKA